MKIISLFSGCGGLDLGLIQAGNTIIWANDIDKDACATYRENIGNHIICDDIKNIDVSTLPDADVVVGGFPCQGFSQANRLRTLNDDRNKLYRFFYNTILIKQPKFFIAENVKGILSLGKGSAIKQIVSDFEAAGYIISVHLVNMADYGVPQTRQRDRSQERIKITCQQTAAFAIIGAHTAVVKLADAPDLGSGAARRSGSSPLGGTTSGHGARCKGMSKAHPFRFYAGPSSFLKNLRCANLFWEPYSFTYKANLVSPWAFAQGLYSIG